MIGGKLLLTYKRKRLLSADTVPQENGYPLLSAEFSSYKTSNILDKCEELAETNVSGNSKDDVEVKKLNYIYIYIHMLVHDFMYLCMSS